MIWLTWRQFRVAATTVFGTLVVLAAVLALTGPGLADDYSTGIAACTQSGGDCSDFLDRFFQDNQYGFLAVTAVMLILPALVGLFWGAPLITRELEAGTHRLIWNQSVTRTRWLAVKLGLTGLAAVAAAGLGSLAVSLWARPIDKASDTFPKMGPLLFDARGIVPIGFAVFAFAVGVTVGMLVRRTLPAMAITLAVFVAVQVAMPLLVRPHLMTPVSSTTEITPASLDGLSRAPGSSDVRVMVRNVVPGDPGAWVLSNETVDASGKPAGAIPLNISSGPCAPADGIRDCLAEIGRLGYRQHATYQPSSRFWAFQWIETGIYTGLALGLAGLSFWRIRRRLS